MLEINMNIKLLRRVESEGPFKYSFMFEIETLDCVSLKERNGKTILVYNEYTDGKATQTKMILPREYFLRCDLTFIDLESFEKPIKGNSKAIFETSEV